MVSLRVRDADQAAHEAAFQLAGSALRPNVPLPLVYAHHYPVNICFTLWPDVIIWYVMESFIFQIYFTTLVYYFSMKYFEKTIKIEERKPYIVTLIIAYVLFCLFELGLFIALVNESSGRCKRTLFSNQKSGKSSSTQLWWPSELSSFIWRIGTRLKSAGNSKSSK